jgi:hypothetical protein
LLGFTHFLADKILPRGRRSLHEQQDEIGGIYKRVSNEPFISPMSVLLLMHLLCEVVGEIVVDFEFYCSAYMPLLEGNYLNSLFVDNAVEVTWPRPDGTLHAMQREANGEYATLADVSRRKRGFGDGPSTSVCSSAFFHRRASCRHLKQENDGN